jgi:putative ABC transport system permease protein
MLLAAVTAIPLSHLAIGFLPVIVVIAIHYYWSLDGQMALYAVARMLAQLLLIGYVLVYVFDAGQPGIVIAVLGVMLAVASWISLRAVGSRQKSLYPRAFAAIALGGVSTLVLVTQAVLQVDPWFKPQTVIPLAGMIFASSMNTVSLAAERLGAETTGQTPYLDARRIAFRTSLIPTTNQLFAVGLVSLPGMMTGQILAGEAPHIAARYQIMVMCMLFGSAGISSACYLVLAKPSVSDAPLER